MSILEEYTYRYSFGWVVLRQFKLIIKAFRVECSLSLIYYPEVLIIQLVDILFELLGGTELSEYVTLKVYVDVVARELVGSTELRNQGHPSVLVDLLIYIYINVDPPPPPQNNIQDS